MENGASSLNEAQQELCAVRQAIGHVQDDVVSLRSRIDEMEHRSRRDNLIFHGFVDCPSETWAQTEQNVIAALSTLEISADCIARAHGIGYFKKDKCRPVIVKLESFKAKDKILQSRLLIKEKILSVNEDISPATRLARSRLFDFGKSPGFVFSVRYNKLHANNKVYAYDPREDLVHEVINSGARRIIRNHHGDSHDALEGTSS